jgi:hypothetical protein
MFSQRRVLAATGIFLLVVLSFTFYSPSFEFSRSTHHVQMNDHHDEQKVRTSEDYSSEYRRLLSTIYPSDRVPHSKTLGVASRIYVIGLKRREDRRTAMEKLARAMGERSNLIE